MNNFDSLDKLMELGLSMAVAQQMMNTMNHALNNMQVPGAGQPMQVPKMSYHAVIEGAQAGPFSEEELVRLISEGRLTAQTLVWKMGMPAWVYAQEIPEINRLLMLNPSK